MSGVGCDAVVAGAATDVDDSGVTITEGTSVAIVVGVAVAVVSIGSVDGGIEDVGTRVTVAATTLSGTASISVGTAGAAHADSMTANTIPNPRTDSRNRRWWCTTCCI